MEAITPAQYGLFALVITGAFAVRGATGFGSAVVATPLASLVLPVYLAIPSVAVLLLISSLESTARTWRAVDWREMKYIAPCMVAGSLLGLYIFNGMDATTVAQCLGLFVIAYAVYAMATAGRKESAPRRLPWPVAAAVSGMGSLIGALFGGGSAPFYAMYFKALHLPRDAFRATISLVVLLQVVMRLAAYAGMGLFDMVVVLPVLIGLPFMLLGGKVGDALGDRVSPQVFNRIVGGVLLASGVALTLK